MRYTGVAFFAAHVRVVTRFWATIGLLVVAVGLRAEPPAVPARAEEPADFFSALGLTTRPDPVTDVWHLTEAPAQLGWMMEAGPLPATTSAAPPPGEAFTHILDRMGDAGSQPRSAMYAPGLNVDLGRLRYKLETSGDFYRRTSKLEVPDPQEIWTPYGARDWKAQEKVQIPVPISIPLAEQLFVYGQFDGKGDALVRQQTSLTSKSGVGLKWALIAGSELQVRYATLTSFAETSASRVQPALEVLAKLPLLGPLSLEYTGSAIPAIARSDSDQFKQELRFAYPLKGDNELEFGARYRWDAFSATPTPWLDRAELFFGVKFRR
jgi:hypothetical protein